MLSEETLKIRDKSKRSGEDEMKLHLRIVQFIAGAFFDSAYLHGKWFEDRKIGWYWVLKGIWFQKILGFNRNVPVPINHSAFISNFNNIILGRNNLNNFQSPGTYFQNFGAKIHLGDDCFIAPNVGLITSNHDPANPERNSPGQDIKIGPRCWIGMNAVILPGVILGPGTIVGAGAIVTKSFPDGKVILAGNPAKIIRMLENE